MEREIAKGLLSIGAVFLRPEQPFTWASGIKSPIYCDNRLILTAPEVRKKVEAAIAETVKANPPACEALTVFLSAGSCFVVVEVLRAAGAEVLGVVSIFTYGMKKGLDRLAAADVINHSLSNLDALVEVAAEEGYIKPEDRQRLIAFRDNPSDESWINK